MRAFLGNEPLFRIPAFELTHFSELFIYAGAGLVGGALSAAFIWLIETTKKHIDELPHWRHYGLPAFGASLAAARPDTAMPSQSGDGVVLANTVTMPKDTR